uniref:Uncharacterized protein n=1 Tax=Timema douglasi TaxID=61478 RepID=A0A7R8VHS3_TIMDO|nr:unnamed protein product [Timema douglasi]
MEWASFLCENDPFHSSLVASSDESPVAMKLKKMWLKAPISEDCDTNLGELVVYRPKIGNPVPRRTSGLHEKEGGVFWKLVNEQCRVSIQGVGVEGGGRDWDRGESRARLFARYNVLRLSCGAAHRTILNENCSSASSNILTL